MFLAIDQARVEQSELKGLKDFTKKAPTYSVGDMASVDLCLLDVSPKLESGTRRQASLAILSSTQSHANGVYIIHTAEYPTRAFVPSLRQFSRALTEQRLVSRLETK
uniref:Uncharacterized protein n=1 Tax=Peronospora matthiolae TaxID=2874970 RepID=A0AAV1U449_9STRA